MASSAQRPSARKPFDLRHQAILGTIALAVAVASATGLGHWLHRESSVQTEQAFEVLVPRSAAASQLALQISRCQIAADALEQSGRTPALVAQSIQAWNSAFDRFSDGLTQLDRLALGDADRGTFAQWRTTSQDYRGRFLTAARQAESAGSTRSDSAPGPQWAECRRMAETLGAETGDFAQRALRQVQAGKEQLQTIQAERSSLINVQAIVGFLGVLIAFTWLSRVVLARVRVLSEAVTRLKQGDLHVRLACQTEDELGAIAGPFNELAATLQSSRDQAGKAAGERDALEAERSGLLMRVGREFRGPLSACSSFLDELLQSPERADLRDIAVLLRQNVERLLELSECLLDLARFESKQLELEPTQCSPCELVKETWTIATHRAAAKGRRLTVEYAGQMPESIQADPRQVRQMLLQWLDGACELIPSGNLRLAVRLHGAGAAHPLLQFDIAAPEAAGSVEPGRRAPERPETTEPMNLSLDLAARIAKILGGSARTMGDPSKGGGLCITIPTGSLAGIRLIEPTTLVLQSPAANSPKAKAKLDCRVLVAEDGPENRRFLGLVLTKAGASVVLAENGEQVMQKVGSVPGETCDVILMDMQMPVLDGYEATRRLRQAGYRGQIIAITAHTDAFDKQMCLQAGCDRYLAKPVDRETLLAAVADCLPVRPEAEMAASPEA